MFVSNAGQDMLMFQTDDAPSMYKRVDGVFTG